MATHGGLSAQISHMDASLRQSRAIAIDSIMIPDTNKPSRGPGKGRYVYQRTVVLPETVFTTTWTCYEWTVPVTCAFCGIQMTRYSTQPNSFAGHASSWNPPPACASIRHHNSHPFYTSLGPLQEQTELS